MQDVSALRLDAGVGAATHLQVGVPGHEHVLLLVRALHHHADEGLEALLDGAHLPEEPEAHVRRDLVVARAAGVQLPAEGADELGQPALVGGVDVLVVGLDFELRNVSAMLRAVCAARAHSALLPLLLDRLEAVHDLLLFLLRQDAYARKAFRVRDRSRNVRSVHALIISQ